MMTEDVSALRPFWTVRERDEFNRLELAEIRDSLTPAERLEVDKIDSGAPDLSVYIRQAWHVLEPGTDYVHGWHIDAIAEHLEAVTCGEILRLIINIPPRFMKSLAVSVFWPTWIWTFRPGARFLFASYVQVLSTRDSVKSRRLIQSGWYQERWGDRFKLVGDQNEKTRYENDSTGVRLSTSVGTGTGEGGDFRVLDDPHNQEDVYSDKIRQSDLEWWRQTWSTRANDPKKSSEVIVMQRLHERDLTGYALAEVGGYEHLCLPMRFERDRACVTSIGWSDPRREEGELLWPDRMNAEDLMPLAKRLGVYGVAGQHQQRPAPAGGGIFRKEWWRFWYPAHSGNGNAPLPVKAQNEDGAWVDCEQRPLPPRMDRKIQSWDCAFKDSKASSYVVGEVWGSLGADAYLLDQTRDKLDLPKTCQAVVTLSQRHPEATAKYIEDKANGPAVIQTMQGRIPGLIAVGVQGDKVARAHAVSPFVQAGNVYLPHPALFPWVNDYLAEMSLFPNAEYSDQVDATTQALMRLMIQSHSLADAMRTVGPVRENVMAGIRGRSF